MRRYVSSYSDRTVQGNTECHLGCGNFMAQARELGKEQHVRSHSYDYSDNFFNFSISNTHLFLLHKMIFM